MGKRAFKKGQVFGEWTLLSCLGGGGNGEVWKCANNDGNLGAIKLLKKVKAKPYLRFLDETKIVKENSDVPGIIPIIDQFLPDSLVEGIPYYVMPIASSAENKLKTKTFDEKIDALLELCETLKGLHARGISHRDIKPANILFYDGRYCLTDFGLVNYPKKKDVSNKNEEIGAKWTMAPEMKRESSNADGIKADVYSLAKTAWIIITGKPKGFDGQYSKDSIVGLKSLDRFIYTTPIDNLLTQSTDNDPFLRPSIMGFAQGLSNWKQLNEDFHQLNNVQWLETQADLFPTALPKRVIWNECESILSVLHTLSKYDNLNHMLFPDGGGMDLDDVRYSNESDCIEIDFGGLVHVLKPKRLLFESFNHDPHWNYFRLELDSLAPSGIYEKERYETEFMEFNESLSEVYPADYADYDVVENRNHYNQNGHEIPETARHVTR